MSLATTSASCPEAPLPSAPQCATEIHAENVTPASRDMSHPPPPTDHRNKRNRTDVASEQLSDEERTDELNGLSPLPPLERPKRGKRNRNEILEEEQSYEVESLLQVRTDDDVSQSLLIE